ncbi:hypothetical protein [Mesorhizobium sp. KR2-14]|uniref:P-type ATPase n=1 Tax=Mesorhizobium sp. KR2-14 TaxID=3156610 RepID=UPI0032B312BF
MLLGDRSNMIFSGTGVTYGRGRAVVTATGMQTEMGRIADLLETTLEQPTPLQAEIDQIGRLLGVIVAAIAVAISGTLLFVTGLTGLEAIFDILFLGIALAVAAVPEGLPAVVALVLAIAIKRMAARTSDEWQPSRPSDRPMSSHVTRPGR